jgi:hypothetical protein
LHPCRTWYNTIVTTSCDTKGRTNTPLTTPGVQKWKSKQLRKAKRSQTKELQLNRTRNGALELRCCLGRNSFEAQPRSKGALESGQDRTGLDDQGLGVKNLLHPCRGCWCGYPAFHVAPGVLLLSSSHGELVRKKSSSRLAFIVYIVPSRRGRSQAGVAVAGQAWQQVAP